MTFEPTSGWPNLKKWALLNKVGLIKFNKVGFKKEHVPIY